MSEGISPNSIASSIRAHKLSLLAVAHAGSEMVEANLTLLLLGAVTGDAVGLQEGLDLTREVVRCQSSRLQIRRICQDSDAEKGLHHFFSFFSASSLS